MSPAPGCSKVDPANASLHPRSFCASPLATNSTNSSPPATFLPAICDRDVVEAGPIYQAIVSCPNTRIVLNAHYHITNPGGEELSAGYMHMAQATSAFIGGEGVGGGVGGMKWLA